MSLPLPHSVVRDGSHGNGFGHLFPHLMCVHLKRDFGTDPAVFVLGLASRPKRTTVFNPASWYSTQHLPSLCLPLRPPITIFVICMHHKRDFGTDPAVYVLGFASRPKRTMVFNPASDSVLQHVPSQAVFSNRCLRRQCSPTNALACAAWTVWPLRMKARIFVIETDATNHLKKHVWAAWAVLGCLGCLGCLAVWPLRMEVYSLGTAVPNE